MVSVCFVGTYKPIMCGIADYTSFITRESPVGRWGMLSFDLENYGAPLITEQEVVTGQVGVVFCYSLVSFLEEAMRP